MLGGGSSVKELLGRSIAAGVAEGEAITSSMPISFFGGVDPDSGKVIERGHDLYGKVISGKVLVFPTGKGSTVGSYTLYRLKKVGLAPAAMVNTNCDPVVAVGAIISNIPTVDLIDISEIANGDTLTVDGDRGKVFINARRASSHG